MHAAASGALANKGTHEARNTPWFIEVSHGSSLARATAFASAFALQICAHIVAEMVLVGVVGAVVTPSPTPDALAANAVGNGPTLDRWCSLHDLCDLNSPLPNAGRVMPFVVTPPGGSGPADEFQSAVHCISLEASAQYLFFNITSLFYTQNELHLLKLLKLI